MTAFNFDAARRWTRLDPGRKLGLEVLTATIADFDFLLQLVPSAKVLFYRRQ